MFGSGISSFTANSSSRSARGRGRRNNDWSKQQQYGQVFEQPLHYQTASSGVQQQTQQHQIRTSIKDLSPHQPNTAIVGIVVTKQSVHSFPDKRNPGNERFTCTFTIRDSHSDFINVTCWGSEEFIKKIHSTFKICDVVELQNCQILSKAGGEQEDRWKPWTPSQYQLNVSESHSTLSLYTGWDYTDFSALAHSPLRPHNDYYTLSDIMSNGHSLDGSHINMLAIVRHVGVPKQMTSKSGKALKKCDVKLMDDGCHSFMMFLWDDVVIDLAQTWIPKQNIVFIVDAKVTFDSYRNNMVATCDQKTIITTNPDTTEAHQLYQYAQSVDLGSLSEPESFGGHSLSSSQSDLQSISQIYSVEGLKQQQQQDTNPDPSQTQSNGGTQFTGILFVFLTSLEIDQDIKSVICYRCTSCWFRVDSDAMQCRNQGCPSHNNSITMGSGFTSEPHFNLLISLSDHTGGVDGVRLSGQPASDIFGCTPQDFLLMNERRKTGLKHRLLFERYKVYFKSTTSHLEQRKPVIQILSMQHTTNEEVARYIIGVQST